MSPNERTPPARHFAWVYHRLLRADVHPALLEPLCPLAERAACVEATLARYFGEKTALAIGGIGEGRHGRTERLARLEDVRAGIAICKAEIEALFVDGDALVERIKSAPRPVNPELRARE